MSRFGQRTRVGQAVSDFGQLPSAGGIGPTVLLQVVQQFHLSHHGIDGVENYTLLTFTVLIAQAPLTVVTSAGLFDVLLLVGGGGWCRWVVPFKQWRQSGGGGAGQVVGLFSLDQPLSI
jgi:hypothetical protein